MCLSVRGAEACYPRDSSIDVRHGVDLRSDITWGSHILAARDSLDYP